MTQLQHSHHFYNFILLGLKMAEQTPTTPVVTEEIPSVVVEPVIPPVEEAAAVVVPVVNAVPVVEAAAATAPVVENQAVVDASTNTDAPTPVLADANPAPAVVVAEQEGSDDKKRKTPEEGGEEEEDKEPVIKKQRITRATIRKFLNKGKLLEHQMFTWRDWSPLDEKESGDVVFTGCKMKIEVKNEKGEVILTPKQSVRRVELYTSKSMVIFYPDGSIASSIICPLQLNVLTPVL